MTLYDCKEAFRRLDAYVDRELAPDEVARVEEHLATCVNCAREFAFERRLLEELKTKLRRIDVPRSVRESVRAVLAGKRRGPPGADKAGGQGG
jgi:anti-sigma factor (TIGR02949 family)